MWRGRLSDNRKEIYDKDHVCLKKSCPGEEERKANRMSENSLMTQFNLGNNLLLLFTFTLTYTWYVHHGNCLTDPTPIWHKPKVNPWLVTSRLQSLWSPAHSGSSWLQALRPGIEHSQHAIQRAGEENQRNPYSFRRFIGFLKTSLLSCFWVWWPQLHNALVSSIVTEFLFSHKNQLSFNPSSNPVRQILKLHFKGKFPWLVQGHKANCRHQNLSPDLPPLLKLVLRKSINKCYQAQ